jgi:hypothetical protein
MIGTKGGYASLNQTKFFAYALLMLLLAVACYVRPSPDDFDRYVYEALIRSSKQPIEQIFEIVKHESPRAEASAVMNSPEHLAQLEPLYAIRPLYLELASVPTKMGLSPRKSIDLLSAVSLFLIAMLAYACTENGLYSAILVSASTIVILGRTGGPDALSSLVLVGGCMAVLRNRLLLGTLLLITSVWIRTDNVLIVLATLGWLGWERKLKIVYAGVLGSLAIGSVQLINSLSGNYGWRVLLHYSFVGGKYPAQITSDISLTEYARAFFVNAESLLPQIVPYLLLGLITWKIGSNERGFLIPVLAACTTHYFLFPSSEARYFAWACILTGFLLIRALRNLPARTIAVDPQPEVEVAA